MPSRRALMAAEICEAASGQRLGGRSGAGALAARGFCGVAAWLARPCGVAGGWDGAMDRSQAGERRHPWWAAAGGVPREELYHHFWQFCSSTTRQSRRRGGNRARTASGGEETRGGRRRRCVGVSAGSRPWQTRREGRCVRLGAAARERAAERAGDKSVARRLQDALRCFDSGAGAACRPSGRHTCMTISNSSRLLRSRC